MKCNTVSMKEHFYRVALHVREKSLKKDPIVNSDHMTPEHRKYLNYNTEDFLIWAGSVGHSTKAVVKSFLTAGKEAEQGFKSCASLTKLADKYGSERLEQVCSKVLTHTSAPSIRIISTVLKNGHEEENVPSTEPDYANSYGITRGEAYFRKGGASK